MRRRDSIFQRKFHRWVKRMGEAKANVAIAHSLLELVYALLKQGRPYREPDPEQMHALEKAKLVRHHASRLRKLGADETLVAQLLAQVNSAPISSPQPPKPAPSEPSHPPPPERIRKSCPGKVRRGALGVRARQTRPQEYAVLKEKKAGTSPSTPTSKRKRSPEAKNKPASSVPAPGAISGG